MQNWFYIVYLDKEGDIREYEIRRTKPEFIEAEMDQYVRFSGLATRGEAYAIREGAVRPNFNKPFKVSTLPF